ncbi:MAG: hypothetical protein WA652_19800 [Xanthobacteraceae bacterium]
MKPWRPHLFPIRNFSSAAIFWSSLEAGSEIAISPRSQRATVFEVTPTASAKAI